MYTMGYWDGYDERVSAVKAAFDAAGRGARSAFSWDARVPAWKVSALLNGKYRNRVLLERMEGWVRARGS